MKNHTWFGVNEQKHFGRQTFFCQEKSWVNDKKKTYRFQCRIKIKIHIFCTRR